MKTFADFVDLCCEQTALPEADARRCLLLHMDSGHISEQDVVIYINYPEYTESEMGRILGLSQRAVSRALARVRKVWPALRNDPIVRENGTASIPEMVSYESWMDDQVTHKF